MVRLLAELEGEVDAVAEENTPQTPGGAAAADDGDGGWGVEETPAKTAEARDADGGWGAADTSANADVAPTADEPKAPAEPEEIQKSYDEFVAERAQAALSSGLGKKEARQVNSESLEGKAFRREATEDVYFAGKVCQSFA